MTGYLVALGVFFNLESTQLWSNNVAWEISSFQSSIKTLAYNLKELPQNPSFES